MCAASCQSADATASPAPPSVTPALARTARPTEVRVVGTRPPTITPTPLEDPFAVNVTALFEPPNATLDPALLTQIAPPAAFLPSHTTLIGRSAGGLGILARRIDSPATAAGQPARLLLLAGGMHGGWEANTVQLINELITYFAENPLAIPAGIALLLIPVVNPDGLPYGREAQGRFNASGVDLNRNWGCGWQDEAFWRELPVNPGAYPFSETETTALADYIQQVRPQVTLFYHSAAGGVYAGSCPQSLAGEGGAAASAAMSEVYGRAANYRFGEAFDAYPVTGTAAGWAAGLGIAAADVELQTWTQSEFERNLTALRAVMAWMLEQPLTP
jgi:hypothetical protein